MRLRVGCRFEYETEQPAPSVVLVHPHSEGDVRLVREAWSTDPPGGGGSFVDLYGNRCERVTLGPGPTSFGYDAEVEISPEPEPEPAAADRQHPIELLPGELLHWLLPSRYCQSDELADEVWELFGALPPGAERVQAVCDWIHEHVEYGVPSIATTTTVEVFRRRGGVCRDLAHLGVTFCRALGVPARYVFGYMPDIGIPGPYPPMDFHAWFEVWLGDRWWTRDARFNMPRIGRVPIGRGRDAVDVAMVTTYGTAMLRAMTVWADEIAAPAQPAPATATADA